MRNRIRVRIIVKQAPTVHCLETTELENNMYGLGRHIKMDAGNSVLTSLDPNEVSTFHVRSIMLWKKEIPTSRLQRLIQHKVFTWLNLSNLCLSSNLKWKLKMQCDCSVSHRKDRMQTILAIQFLKKLTTEHAKSSSGDRCTSWGASTRSVHHLLHAILTEELSVQSAVRKRGRPSNASRSPNHHRSVGQSCCMRLDWMESSPSSWPL